MIHPTDGVESSTNPDVRGVVMTSESPTALASRASGYRVIYGLATDIVMESSTDLVVSGAVCSCRVVCSI